MRNLVIGINLLFLLIAHNSYAVDITITLTDDQFKALQVLNVTPQEWVEHAVKSKADKMYERLVDKYSDKKFSKMTAAEKDVVFDAIDIVAEKALYHEN